MFRSKGMEKITEKDIKWLLNLHKTGKLSGKEVPVRPKIKSFLLKAALIVSGTFGLIILPFFLLIRTSVYLYLSHNIPGWISLSGGMAATVLLLITYIFLLFRNIQNKKQLLKFSLGGAGVMVFGFCMLSLFYLSAMNAKSPQVRDLYRSMHPILRVAVSTATLADSGVVITDIERVPESYTAMGLPVNPNSLHYRQENGYVHALDIRTRNRGFIRNGMLRGSLSLMGFRTLRHTGTADHLHVELPLHK